MTCVLVPDRCRRPFMNISYINFPPSFFVTPTPQFSNHHQGWLKLASRVWALLCGSELTPDGLVTAELGHLRTPSQLPSSYRVHTRCFRCSVNLQHPERAQQEARHDSVSGKGLTLLLGFVISWQRVSYLESRLLLRCTANPSPPTVLHVKLNGCINRSLSFSFPFNGPIVVGSWAFPLRPSNPEWREILLRRRW